MAIQKFMQITWDKVWLTEQDRYRVDSLTANLICEWIMSMQRGGTNDNIISNFENCHKHQCRLSYVYVMSEFLIFDWNFQCCYICGERAEHGTQPNYVYALSAL